MAEYISFQPSDFFNTKLYTGTGSTQSITGVGFQPDLAWGKETTGTQYPSLVDAVRGTTKYVYSNVSNAEATASDRLTSFDADGFTLGSAAHWNANTETYVAWNWKAGTTSGIATNGSTTITPSSYSFNQTAGISILQYTGNETAGAKLAHGLGAVPAFMIFKHTDESGVWQVYHQSLGNTKHLNLNETDAVQTSTTRWNDTSPDSVNVTLGTTTYLNKNSGINIRANGIRLLNISS